jgi:monovalent cation/proton antiporter MnhG/PhaG subunit
LGHRHRDPGAHRRVLRDARGRRHHPHARSVHADAVATKAGTLGVACLVAAAATHFRTSSVVIEASLVILFLFATAPVASHLIARAAFVAGTPLWNRTSRDIVIEDTNGDGTEPSSPGVS